MSKYIFTSISLVLLGFMVPGKLLNRGINDPVQQDGPYVWYSNGQVQVRYILGDSSGAMTIKADSVAESNKDKLVLAVATDIPGQVFEVRLKKSIQKEKNEYKKAGKQYVISDIEGNFGPFRKLLIAGGVIDSVYNWTFGEGHLVLVGDFFDRGSQVTEVLWLIYALENKARAAGGYVHFILGNHEIMNLSGDTRYVHKKYLEALGLLKTSYLDLFNSKSELGRWLLSKNIIEKIGDMLYIHGGISTEVNDMDISISDINELAQPWYQDSTQQYTDPKIATIFTDNGPFWYRGYYKTEGKAPQAQINRTLRKFDVKQIITGHTMIADTISVLYNGRVINTDTHHAAGKSEALFIENGKFYRVSLNGEKFLVLSKKN